MATANQTVKKVLDHLNTKIGTGGVTSSWTDGNGSWYRVYNDGFIEQGGKYQAPGNNTRAKVTLPRQFSSTNYSVQMAVYAELGTSTYWGPTNGVGAIIHKTASTFEAGNVYSTTIYNKPTYIEWYACGY